MQNRSDVRFYIMYLIGRCGYPAERASLTARNPHFAIVVAVGLLPPRRLAAMPALTVRTETSTEPREPSRAARPRQAPGVITSPIVSRS
jgi:hypothetical protein